MNALFSGGVAFIAVFVIGNSFLGPRMCADGWASPSIGKRGACSHHGGVVGPKGSGWVFLLSVVSGITVSIAYAAREDRKRRLSTQRPTYLDVIKPVLYDPNSFEEFEILYTNASGRKGVRRIKLSWESVRMGDSMFKAYCCVRKEDRTFRFDRIEKCISVSSGNTVSDLKMYLVEKKLSHKIESSGGE